MHLLKVETRSKTSMTNEEVSTIQLVKDQVWQPETGNSKSDRGVSKGSL